MKQHIMKKKAKYFLTFAFMRMLLEFVVTQDVCC